MLSGLNAVYIISHGFVPTGNVIKLSKPQACAEAKQPGLALPAAQSGRHELHEFSRLPDCAIQAGIL
jgi:hypothetical protein